MKIEGIVTCRVCSGETFRLVVPFGKGTVQAISECTKCGEWCQKFDAKQMKKTQPKKETS